MKKLASYFYYFYFGLVYLTSSLVLWLPIFLFVRGKKKYRVAKQIRTFWAKFLTTLIGIKIDVKYESSVIEKQNYIICANHKSYLDIILMYLIINKDFAFLGKSEILKWPVINIFFKRGIDITVYRGSKTRSHECLQLAEIEIKRGRSVVIFPEGGWDKTGKNMRSFKNGAFQLAIDTKCPILPITFKNNYDLFTDHKDFSGNSKPGLAKVIVHDSISTDNLTREDLVDFRDKTYEVIKTEIEYENRY